MCSINRRKNMKNKFYKDQNRTKMISEVKNILITIKPEKDERYGNMYQKLFLDDYIFYAFLRNKQDFTKCAHDKQKAIDSAKGINKFLKNVLDDSNRLVNEGHSGESALIKALSKWHHSRYRNLADYCYYMGDTPIESLTILIDEIDEAINKYKDI